jgi:peroxidase
LSFPAATPSARRTAGLTPPGSTTSAALTVQTHPSTEYADRLRTRCSSVDDKTTLTEMDPGSYKTFDTSYFRQVAKRRGLFQSDAALLADAATRDYVQRIATGKFDDVFFKDFSESMIKMGNVGVITGADGEIRKKCYIVN